MLQLEHTCSSFSNCPLQEFANFVDDLGMNLPFSDTHDLYNTLSAPCDGMLVLSNFYKNLLGDTCSLTELHRRLEEAGFSIFQTFAFESIALSCLVLRMRV